MVTIQRPVHAHLGEMKVDGSEYLSMKEEEIGTSRVYYDMKKAQSPEEEAGVTVRGSTLLPAAAQVQRKGARSSA